MTDNDSRIAQFVQDGWHRQSAIDWKKATLAALRSEGAGDTDELIEAVRDAAVSPDLWRIVKEGPGGPDEWSYPVNVLEYLYFTQPDAIATAERRWINSLWWAMDSTSTWYLRLHCLDPATATVRALTIQDVYRNFEV